jgi:multimeric flavodoxin WrbA
MKKRRIGVFFMKVLAVNGSPHKDGNTRHMIDSVLQICADAGCETEVFQAGGLPVRGCLSCNHCMSHPGECVTKDWVIDVYEKMKAADAIIIGSPVYYADLTAEIKAMMDRTGYLAMSEGGALKRKVGAAVSAVRRAGAIHTLDSIQHWFLIQSMIVPGSSYWNLSLALNPGDYEKDDEGKWTMKTLGENIVWLLDKID